MTVVRPLALALFVLVALLVVADRVFDATFPSQPRLAENFSSAYVAREFARMRDRPRTTVVLGDSVLWGYALPADRAAPALLARRGIRVANFAYEGGSPINTYATLRAMLASGVRPRRVLFNVNQKTFNAADGAYAVVAPSMWRLARRSFDVTDARAVATPSDARTPDARLDRAVERVWHLYAMRADLREALFGAVDAAHALDASLAHLTGRGARASAAHVPRPDDFEGTYDLTPLGDDNLSVRFLRRTIALLAANHIPALAILTPTNHVLLHRYVDTPGYAANLAYVRRLLERGDVRVLDLDAAFGPRSFLDNDHLTSSANVRFADAIAKAIART